MRNLLVLSVLLFTMAAGASAQSKGVETVWIGLANNLEVEATMAEELRMLLRSHDVSPWVMTRKVLIDRTQIPHSHPVLTLHTRHIGDPDHLLSTFVHEQLHWLEDGPWLANFQSAMSEFERLFPNVPSSADGGARDRQSTYRHLLVCDMELQAMTALLGEKKARDTLADITHYEWIYDRVLNDPRIREVALKYGFDVSKGIPPAESRVFGESDADTIAKIRARSNQAIRDHDAATIVSSYDDVYQMTTGSGELYHDNAEQEQQLWEEHFEEFPDVVYVRTPDSIDVSGNLARAAENGTWVGTRTTDKGPIEMGGSYSASWRNIEGEWKLQSEMFVSLYCNGDGC